MGRVRGKTIVITGGSSGIGAAAAKILASRGAHVVITGRSELTTKVAAEAGCDYFFADYARLSDVRRLAQDLQRKFQRIDVLVNNVGGIFGERTLTSDGHEMTFQVNHLGGFLLTNLLREQLEESKTVVINTSSMAHLFGRIDFDDLQGKKKYVDGLAYSASKLMNVLHAMEINRRFKGVRAVSFHPGAVRTRFARQGKGLISLVYETALKHLVLIPPEKGADTMVWLAEAEPEKDWIPGEYYYKRKPAKKNRHATAENARRLWEVSEALIAQCS